ncbi:MAG TPA: hypothetical protein VHN12_08925 [Geobacteraceae bacterium]|nr:hypothetical protein [Geobacteraceae bacterium]
MKKVMLAVMCAVMLFGTIAIGYAERGDWRGGIRTRIHEAKERIDRGIDRRTLTRHEARRLQGELDRILYKIDRMKEDGHLSQRDREKINHDLDRLNRDISRERRDDDTGRRGYDHRHR